MKIARWLAVLVFLGASISGCDSAEERDLKRGLHHQSAGEFREALAKFESTMKRAPGSPSSLRAARESVKIRVFDIKSYDRAIEDLKFLILYSKDPQERWRSQNQIAQIYFDNLARYDKALVEYSRLLSSPASKEEEWRVKMAIARCYYYLGQVSHSWTETNYILAEENLPSDLVFDALFLLANIQLSQKKYRESAQSLEKLSKNFPERAKKENVGINLSLCYEELGEKSEAIRVLEELRPFYEPKDYIDLRIKKIRDRFSDLPRKKAKE